MVNNLIKEALQRRKISARRFSRVSYVIDRSVSLPALMSILRGANLRACTMQKILDTLRFLSLNSGDKRDAAEIAEIAEIAAEFNKSRGVQ